MPPSPAPHTCWCYLIRHAATDNNRARPPRLQGRRTDPGLSDEGHLQAKATGDYLAAGHMDAVYSSPLLHARQTAEALDALLHAYVEKREIKMGQIIHALRVATTGQAVGFGMFETLAIVGREQTCSRIARALSLI